MCTQKDGAFGGIWTRDHYLTKVTPHRARLRRHTCVVLRETMHLCNKTLTVKIGTIKLGNGKY